MNNVFAYVRIKPYPDVVNCLLEFSDRLSLFEGVFTVTKDSGEYKLENYGILTILSKDLKQAFILCNGKLINFGRVSEISKKPINRYIRPSKIEVYKDIQKQIEILQSKKSKLFATYKEKISFTKTINNKER